MAADPEFERLRVVHIDSGGTVINIAEYCDEQPGRVAVPIRRIAAAALASNADALILSHNHPRGDPQPSHADIAATQYLVRALSFLNIRVHDHIVTGAGRSFSFRRAGLL